MWNNQSCNEPARRLTGTLLYKFQENSRTREIAAAGLAPCDATKVEGAANPFRNRSGIKPSLVCSRAENSRQESGPLTSPNSQWRERPDYTQRRPVQQQQLLDSLAVYNTRHNMYMERERCDITEEGVWMVFHQPRWPAWIRSSSPSLLWDRRDLIREFSSFSFFLFLFSSRLALCVCVCLPLSQNDDGYTCAAGIKGERDSKAASAGRAPASNNNRAAGWLAGPITVWSMLAIKRAPRLYRIYCAGPKQKTAAGRKWAW